MAATAQNHMEPLKSEGKKDEDYEEEREYFGGVRDAVAQNQASQRDGAPRWVPQPLVCSMPCQQRVR